MNILKKVLTVGVVMATIVWTMGVTAFVPSASAVTLAGGDLIKAGGDAVYFYAADGQRYTFPNEPTFKSWFSDFSSVKTITDDELSAIDLAGNVVIRPGTYLVKITSMHQVFAVEPEGMLREIDSATAASDLYGADWGSRIVDVPDGFWTNYTNANESLMGDEYPEGQLVMLDGSPDVFYVNGDGSWSLIPDEATFNANMFRWEFVVTAPAGTAYTAGPALMTGAHADLLDVSQGGGVVVAPVGGPLAASLSSSNPAGGIAPLGTPVDMLRVDLAAGSEAVSVSALTVKGGGLGDIANDITEITAYVNGVKQGNAKSNLGSDKETTFNFATPIVIDANTKKAVTFKATLTGESYFNLALSGVVADSASVSGLPVTGNTFQAVVNDNLGELAFDGFDVSTTAMVGEDNVRLAEFDVTEASNNESVWFESLRLKNKGGLGAGELGVMTLFHDGMAVATGELDADKYVDFVFDPIWVEEGQTESFYIEGDIDGGNTTDTVELYIKDTSDVVVTGADSGYQSTLDLGNMDDTLTVIDLSAGELVINFDKAAVPAADIRKETTNVVLGLLELTATSEALEIDEGMKFDLFGSHEVNLDDLEAFELYDLQSGGIYELTGWSTPDYTVATNEIIELAAGETRAYELRADVTADAEADDQYKVTLDAVDITARGVISDAAVNDITPSHVTSAQMTVVTSDLTQQPQVLNNNTIVAGAADVKAYKSLLKTSTASSVTISKVVFCDDSNGFTSDNISLATLEINGSEVKAKSGSQISSYCMTFDGFQYVVPANTTEFMYLLLDTNASATGGIQMSMTSMTAKDDQSDKVIPNNGSDVNGSVSTTLILAPAGKLAVTLETDQVDANRDSFVLAGNTSDFVGSIEFDAQDEDVVVKDLVLANSEAHSSGWVSSIDSVQLVASDMATVVAETSDLTDDGYTHLLVSFTDWNHVISEPGTTRLYIRVVTKEIGDAAEQTAQAGHEIYFYIDSVVAEGAASFESINPTYFGVEFTQHAIVTPLAVTGIMNELPSGILGAGAATKIGQFGFTFDAGNNAPAGLPAEFSWYDSANFTLSMNGSVTVADVIAYWESDPLTTTSCGSYTTSDTVTCDMTDLNPVSANDSLVFEAEISDVSANESVQISMMDLDGDSNFDWSPDAGTSDFSQFLLDYTKVTGGILVTP